MCVITVSGGWYRGAKSFAEALADRLEFRIIHRDTLVRRAAEAGIREDEVQSAMLRPPSLFDRLITHKKYIYLTRIQALLADEVSEGRVVYHGYAGHLLLAGAGPVFRVRIIGAEASRLKALERELRMSPEEARAHVRKVDQDRRKWTRHLYGVDWEDPALYDVVIHLGELLKPADACDMIAPVIQSHQQFQLTPERLQQLEDFAVACRVRAELAAEAPAANFHVDAVTASGGTVQIRGALDEAEQILDIERIAASVPGVSEVDLRY